jgi:uncharacterized membrane protein
MSDRMSGSQAGQVPAPQSEGGSPATVLCVLLACFAGPKRAAKIRRQLDKRITGGGGTILDQVIVKIDAKHKVQVHDPRRTLAGTLTCALTWGIFGLLAGGLRSLGVWAIIGAVCGGLGAYYYEHLASKDELKRIGGQLPGDSSAIAAFVQGTDPRQVLSSAASYEPTTASVAAIGGDLSAHVFTGASSPAGTSSPAAVSAPVPVSGSTMVNMLLFRYPGKDTARRQMARAASAGQKDGRAVKTELVFEAPEHGRLKVSDPTHGSAAMSKSDLISWGLFGLVYGAIVGVAGHNGILGHAEGALVNGIVWALFGLAAGALYGLWAGRGVSARRMKGVRPLLPPGTSTVLGWAEGDLTQQAIDGWSAPGSQQLILRFNPAGDGVLLEA